MADYSIFYRCPDNSGPYYAYGKYDWGVYYCGNDNNYYIFASYSDEPYGSEISNLSYYGSECPPGAFTIFYRCGDNAGPYFTVGPDYSGVYYYSFDGQYYRVDHYSYNPEGEHLDGGYLSYYGSVCPPHSYTIFYRCGDNAGPYFTVGPGYSGVYYSSFDGQYYRVDHYSYTPEGDYISFVYLSYYGANCPGGASFNPAWALYTNAYVGIGHV